MSFSGSINSSENSNTSVNDFSFSSDSESHELHVITPVSPIPDVMTMIKDFSIRGEFNKVQDLLVEREKHIQKNFEYMRSHRDFLMRMKESVEQEKLKCEEKLQKCLSECDNFKEEIIRLNDQRSKLQDRHSKVSCELFLVKQEKEAMMSILNEKINSLNNQRAENVRLGGVSGSSSLSVLMERMRLQQMVVDLSVEELRRQNLEAAENLKKMQHQILAADRDRLGRSEETEGGPRGKEIILDRAVNDRNLEANRKVDEMRHQGVPVEAENTRARAKKGKQLMICQKPSCGPSNPKNKWNNKGSEESSLQGLKSKRIALGSDTDNVPIDGNQTVDEMRHQATGSRKFPRSALMIGDGLKNDRAAYNSPNQNYNYNPQAESNGTDQEHEHGNERLQILGGPVEAKNERARAIKSKQSMICQKPYCGPSNLKNKRNNKGSEDSSLQGLQRKRIALGRDTDNAPIDGQTAKQNLVATHSGREIRDGLESQKLGKEWMSKSDMLKDFHKDKELCMHAVCALYRHQINASKSAEGSDDKFDYFNAMRGRLLAKYLIDQDPELRLRKCVSEVKSERPSILNECVMLAMAYSEELFTIYCNGRDPFFTSK